MASINSTNNRASQPATKDNYVPIIDFSTFSSHSPTSTSTAHSILHAFSNSGFLYLTHHGIPNSLIHCTFRHSAAFFARSLPEKEALAWTSARANRGYTCLGREKVSQGLDSDSVASVRETEGEDLKESFEIGREDEVQTVPGCANLWPDDEAGVLFQRDANEFFDACKVLHARLMSAIAVALGTDADWFDAFTDRGDNTLRLLHYPPVRKSVFQAKKGQVRAGAHSDYGSVTLLFQDRRGGLQVKGLDGEWIDVAPIEGTVVVNAGDLLARWSNDLIRSTLHRVVEPPLGVGVGRGSEVEAEDAKRREEEGEADPMYPARYSIAYFCNPNFNKTIDIIPGIVREGEEKKYEAVNSGEYLLRRLKATY